MKNLVLFLILVCLAIFTYYFEELEQIKKNLESDRQTQLFSMEKLGELKGIKTSVTEFFKVGDQYYTGKNHRLVDRSKMDSFLEVLSHLRIKRILDAEEIGEGKRTSYFTDDEYRFEFIFSGGKITYLLGKKLNFDQSFYVEVEKDGQKKWVIAHDSSQDTGIYRKDLEHRSDRKYQRLIRMTLLREDFFYDLALFKKKTKKKSWERGELINKKNRNFKINFSDNVVSPKCPSGITPDIEAIDSFANAVSDLKGNQIYYPYRRKLLKEWVSSLKLTDFDGKKYKIDLFKKYGSLGGYFLRSSFTENLYELEQSTAQLLFSPHQAFCNLRPPFYEVGGAKREVFFDISFKNGTSYKLYIPWKDKFEVNLLDKKLGEVPNNIAFKSLFKFFSQKAERVTSDNNSKLMSKALMTITYIDQPFFVIYQNDEIILLSLKHKYMLHYPVGKDVPIGLFKNDYFIKEKI